MWSTIRVLAPTPSSSLVALLLVACGGAGNESNPADGGVPTDTPGTGAGVAVGPGEPSSKGPSGGSGDGSALPSTGPGADPAGAAPATAPSSSAPTDGEGPSESPGSPGGGTGTGAGSGVDGGGVPPEATASGGADGSTTTGGAAGTAANGAAGPEQTHPGGGNSQGGSGGGSSAAGGVASGGSAAASGDQSDPVDCDAITSHSEWELCDAGPEHCGVVYTDGAGCVAVCAAAGLACTEVWENAADACAPDEGRAQLTCDPESGHESDYCLCTATGNAPDSPAGGGAPGSGGATGSDASGGLPPTGGSEASAGEGGSGEPGGAGGGSGSGGAALGGGPDEIGGSGATGGGGDLPDIGPGPCGCENPNEEWGTVDATIVVGAGEVYDGGCKIYRANPSTLGPGDQSEDQSPVFRVENGGTLRNVVLGASAADGIHLYGDVSLENIHWLDIGEDAMTVKESGTVNLFCGSSRDGEDKTFQVNASSVIHISHFTARDAGKFMRQNGDTTFHVEVTIDHCDIANMDEVIFRTDSTTSHVTLTNTRYSNLGRGLFMFGDTIVDGDSAQSTVSNNEEY